MSHGYAGARLSAAEMVVGLQHPTLKEALRAGTLEKAQRDPINVCEYLIIWGGLKGVRSKTHLSGVLSQDKKQQGQIQVRDSNFKAKKMLLAEHFIRLSGEFVEALSLGTGKTG